jgi:hypothetical protein
MICLSGKPSKHCEVVLGVFNTCLPGGLGEAPADLLERWLLMIMFQRCSAASAPRGHHNV